MLLPQASYHFPRLQYDRAPPWRSAKHHRRRHPPAYYIPDLRADRFHYCYYALPFCAFSAVFPAYRQSAFRKPFCNDFSWALLHGLPDEPEHIQLHQRRHFQPLHRL